MAWVERHAATAPLGSPLRLLASWRLKTVTTAQLAGPLSQAMSVWLASREPQQAPQAPGKLAPALSAPLGSSQPAARILSVWTAPLVLCRLLGHRLERLTVHFVLRANQGLL